MDDIIIAILELIGFVADIGNREAEGAEHKKMPTSLRNFMLLIIVFAVAGTALMLWGMWKAVNDGQSAMWIVVAVGVFLVALMLYLAVQVSKPPEKK